MHLWESVARISQTRTFMQRECVMQRGSNGYNAFSDIKTVTSKRISLLKIRRERERERYPTGRWKNKLVVISEKIIWKNNCWKINEGGGEKKN